MKTTTNTFRSRVAAGIACLAALTFTTANAAWAEPHASNDEIAVWQAAAGVVAHDYVSSPYKVWYFQSDFTAASFISTALIDPDRDKVCGLSEPEARTLISDLKAVNAEPMKLDKSVAQSAGFGIAYRKIPRQRYFAMSRVVFDPAGRSAWLSVELNGERGFIVRLDKVDGQWNKTSRCGGWYMPDTPE
jgi:hypothetical protein